MNYEKATRRLPAAMCSTPGFFTNAHRSDRHQLKRIEEKREAARTRARTSGHGNPKTTHSRRANKWRNAIWRWNLRRVKLMNRFGLTRDQHIELTLRNAASSNPTTLTLTP